MIHYFNSKPRRITTLIFAVLVLVLPLYFMLVHKALMFSVNRYTKNTSYFVDYLGKQFQNTATRQFTNDDVLTAINIVLSDTSQAGKNGRDSLEKWFINPSDSLSTSNLHFILNAYNSNGLIFNDKSATLKEFIFGNNDSLSKMVSTFSKDELNSNLKPILLDAYLKTEDYSTLFSPFQKIQSLNNFRDNQIIKSIFKEFLTLDTLRNQLSDLNSTYGSVIKRIGEIRPPLPTKPEKVEYQWLSGYIVRQLDAPLVYEIELNNGESAALRTSETEFKSAGYFSIYAALYYKGSTKDRNNFTRDFNIYKEVPKSVVEKYENSLDQYEKDFEYANNWESIVKDNWILDLIRESKQMPKTIANQNKEVILQENKLKSVIKAFINSLEQGNTTNQDNDVPKTVKITNSKIRQIDFNNFIYQIHGTKESITVKDGQSLTPIPGLNSSSIFDILEIAYGDVNSDGIEDAAIMTYSGESTASARTQDLYFYTLRNNKPYSFAFISNNKMFESLEMKMKPNLSNWFRWVSFNEVDIIDNNISVSWRYAESAKPRFITTLYRWNGNSFDAVR